MRVFDTVNQQQEKKKRKKDFLNCDTILFKKLNLGQKKGYKCDLKMT